MNFRLLGTLGVGLLVAATCTTVLAPAQEVAPTTTLWNFLGIPQALNKIHGATFNRRGNRPGLEKKPPLKKLADPENLKSDVPAIKAAAEIKQAEDLKQQKIKAIRYLATIGCGCYDKDEKVTKALLAAMEDCTEEVRLEAVRAISVAASGEYCVHCKQRNCCNEKITAQLSKIAYDRDELGCFIEPSERVREAAIEALGICCPHAEPIEATPVGPVEGTIAPPPVEGTVPRSDTPPPPPTTDNAGNHSPTAIDPNSFLREASIAVLSTPSQANDVPKSEMRSSNEPREFDRGNWPPMSTSNAPIEVPAVMVPHSAPAASKPMGSATPQPPSSRRTARAKVASASFGNAANGEGAQAGVLQLIDPQRNLAHIHFPANHEPVAVGSRLRVFSPAPTGLQQSGELEVVEIYPGSATVRAIGDLNLARLSRDAVVAR